MILFRHYYWQVDLTLGKQTFLPAHLTGDYCYILWYRFKYYLFDKMKKNLLYLEYFILQNTIYFFYSVEYDGNVLKKKTAGLCFKHPHVLQN